MREFLRGALVAGATSAMLVAGATELAPEGTPPPASIQVAETPSATPSHPNVLQINLDQRRLPRDIGVTALSTVEITANWTKASYTDTNGKSLSTLTWMSQGSGTVVEYQGHREVVTAAHVVADTTDSCGNESVTYPGPYSSANYFKTDVKRQSPVTSVSPYDPKTFNHGLDAAVIVPTQNWDISQTQPVPVQQHVDVHPGDTLFSIGYGPRAKWDPAPDAKARGDRAPVIVPGEVLKVDNGLVTFVTGISGPNVTEATGSVHHGDSGGSVVDDRGDYIGDVIASTGDEGLSWSATALENTYNVGVPAAGYARWFSVGVARIVDQSTLAELNADVQPCTAPPLPTQHLQIPVGADPGAYPPTKP